MTRGRLRSPVDARRNRIVRARASPAAAEWLSTTPAVAPAAEIRRSFQSGQAGRVLMSTRRSPFASRIRPRVDAARASDSGARLAHAISRTTCDRNEQELQRAGCFPNHPLLRHDVDEPGAVAPVRIGYIDASRNQHRFATCVVNRARVRPIVESAHDPVRAGIPDSSLTCGVPEVFVSAFGMRLRTLRTSRRRPYMGCHSIAEVRPKLFVSLQDARAEVPGSPLRPAGDAIRVLGYESAAKIGGNLQRQKINRDMTASDAGETVRGTQAAAIRPVGRDRFEGRCFRSDCPRRSLRGRASRSARHRVAKSRLPDGFI